MADCRPEGNQLKVVSVLVIKKVPYSPRIRVSDFSGKVKAIGRKGLG